jgi:hypothetical protein
VPRRLNEDFLTIINHYRQETTSMNNILRFTTVLSMIAMGGTAAWAVDPFNCTPTYSECWIPKNVLQQGQPGNPAGDVVITKTNSNGASAVFRIFNDYLDTGLGTGQSQSWILYSKDTTGVPNPASYSANVTTIPEAATGATDYLSSTGTLYHIDTSAAATRLLYTGNTTGDYNDSAQLSGALTSVPSGLPVAGATLKFAVGTQTCSAMTNASGVGSCAVVINQAPGNYSVSATYSGLFGSYAGATTSGPFAVNREETSFTYNGDTAIPNGGTAHMSGVLLEDGTTPLPGRTVAFRLGSGPAAQSCSAVTNAAGLAACTISPVSQSLGKTKTSSTYTGDAYYKPASIDASVQIN